MSIHRHLSRMALVPVVVGFLAFNESSAQVSINTDGADPDPSAMLDVTSTDKGILIPRMTTAQRDAIATPATGLLIFNSVSNAFEYYNGTAWAGLSNAADLEFDQLEFLEITTPISNSGNGLSAGLFPNATQTFTPLENAQLHEVYISLFSNASVEGTLEIYDESYTPTSTPIYTQPYAVTGTSRLERIALDKPVSLNGNQLHTLRLVPTGGDLRTHVSQNTYPGGQFLEGFNQDLEFALGMSRGPLRVDGGGVTFPDGTVLGSCALDLSNDLLSFSGQNPATAIDLSDYRQTLSLGADTLTLSNGGSVDLSGYVDPPQTLGLSSNTLSISGGNSVDLSAYRQTLSLSNSTGTSHTLALTGGGSATFDVADNDNDPGNEIQTLGFDGSILTLSGGGSSVDISELRKNGFDRLDVYDADVFVTNSGSGLTLLIDSEVAQTFTPLEDGYLREVYLSLVSTHSLVGTLEIYDEAYTPASTPIYTQSYAVDGSRLDLVQIDQAVPLVANQVHTLRLVPTGGDLRTHVSNDTYSGGQLVHETYINDLEFALGASASELRITSTGIVFNDGTTLDTAGFLSTYGDIGIGTTSPDSILHVESAATAGGAADGITLTQGNYNSEIYHNSEGDLILRKRIHTDQLVLDEGGAVGIGTNAPTQTLDVNGTVRIRGGSPADGKVLTATNAAGEAVWEDKFSYSHETGAAAINGAAGWQSVLPSPSQALAVEAGTPVLVHCSFRSYNTGAEAYVQFRVQAAGPANVESTVIGVDMRSQKNELYSFHKLITLPQAGNYTMNLQVDTDNAVTVEDLEITTIKLK